ncbi:kinetochore-associated Ndc80 complex subunit spc25 [Phlyctochytrium planicorne]|nr:kinetochore-associated Ndc80 complex subunit spc25 [Phlyctochytrium planicorne]
MSEAYAELVTDYEGLRQDCHAFLQTYNGWLSSKKESIISVKQSFLSKANEQKDKYVQLKSQLEQLQAHMAGLKKAEENERSETREMEKTIVELSQKYDGQMVIKNQLQSDIEILQKRIRERKEKQRHKPDCDFFEAKLAIQISVVEPNVLKIAFTHINQLDWFQEYHFVLDVSNEIYQVRSCMPPVPNLEEYLSLLNRTRDFYTFVKQMRKAFQQVANK